LSDRTMASQHATEASGKGGHLWPPIRVSRNRTKPRSSLNLSGRSKPSALSPMRPNRRKFSRLAPLRYRASRARSYRPRRMKSLPLYKLTSEPRFGPRKRARTLPARDRSTLLSSDESTAVLQRTRRPNPGAEVHRLRVSPPDLSLRDHTGWMSSDCAVRDAAYECAEEMVEATG
jgi:hypothetical protein